VILFHWQAGDFCQPVIMYLGDKGQLFRSNCAIGYFVGGYGVIGDFFCCDGSVSYFAFCDCFIGNGLFCY
jgi:hypothetical protein